MRPDRLYDAAKRVVGACDKTPVQYSTVIQNSAVTVVINALRRHWRRILNSGSDVTSEGVGKIFVWMLHNCSCAASSGKRSVTVWRPSVRPSVPSAYSPWLTRGQHATRRRAYFGPITRRTDILVYSNVKHKTSSQKFGKCWKNVSRFGGHDLWPPLNTPLTTPHSKFKCHSSLSNERDFWILIINLSVNNYLEQERRRKGIYPAPWNTLVMGPHV